MSFVSRQINLQFSGAVEGSIIIEGARCEAMITNPGGDNATATLQLKIYGMTLEHMNQYSSFGSSFVVAQNYSVTVIVGDRGSPLMQVFSGHIYSSFIDFSSAPDVSFVCSATSGYLEKATPVSPNSYPGTQNAEDIIKSLTTSMVTSSGTPWSFSNNNAHAIITNQYISGSIIDQIKIVARAASFPIKIENDTVYIWPNGNNVDGVTIAVGPNSGLVGYPTYIAAGFSIKTQFTSNIANGRKISLTSVIPKANGIWTAHVVTHELSTVLADGPWFTNCILNNEGANSVPRN